MKESETKRPGRKSRRAATPEAREDQMIALAVDLAEQKLRDGTASNSMIIHYLKLGSTKERLEKEILEEQKDLIKAKTESLKSAKQMEELYKSAIDAMRMYGGHTNGDEEDEELY